MMGQAVGQATATKSPAVAVSRLKVRKEANGREDSDTYRERPPR